MVGIRELGQGEGVRIQGAIGSPSLQALRGEHGGREARRVWGRLLYQVAPRLGREAEAKPLAEFGEEEAGALETQHDGSAGGHLTPKFSCVGIP
jgi:hypothetical protein